MTKPARPLLKRSFCFYWLLNLLVFLSACATKTPGQFNLSDNPVALSARDHWSLKARVAIKMPDDSLTATLNWDKNQQDFEFHLYGLLGATYAKLSQKDQMATLELPDHEPAFHENAQVLLTERLGWDFPLQSLSFWVKGLASGHPEEILSKNDNGQLSHLIYRDWSVNFSRYSNLAGYSMPEKIEVNNPALSLKIIIKNWEFY